MKWATLAAIVLLLFAVLAVQTTEYFIDPEFTSSGAYGVATSVQDPCSCKDKAPGMCEPACRVWESKVTAVAPSNAVVDDYIAVLAAFNNSVYKPATSKPTEAQVDTFLASSAGTVAGVDRSSVKTIIMDGFHLDQTGTAASREEKSQMFKPSDTNLAPDMGRDELRTRDEESYNPANPIISTRFAEGDYAPVKQTTPAKPGQWDDGSMIWKGPRPASVCPCAENIV